MATTNISGRIPHKCGVHQGSAFSPLLFILVTDEATKECRGDEIWELYAEVLGLETGDGKKRNEGDCGQDLRITISINFEVALVSRCFHFAQQ